MKLKTATGIALICTIISMILTLSQRVVFMVRMHAGWEWIPEIIIFYGGLIVFFSVLYKKQE